MSNEKLQKASFFTIPNFFTPEECDKHIALSEGRGYKEATITTPNGLALNKDVRDNTRVIIDDLEMAGELFVKATPHFPPRIINWELVGLNERFRYYRYEDGQTFKRHLDGSYVRTPLGKSLFTFMIYLNEGFEGGTTRFFNDDGIPVAEVRPERGMLLAFHHVQLHEGAPVTRGRKYVLRTDVMYRLKEATPLRDAASLDS